MPRPSDQRPGPRPDIEAALQEFIGKNASAVAALHAQEDRRVGRHQRWLESITDVIGTPRFLYLAVLFAVGWVGFNASATLLGFHAWDPPPFPLLQSLLSFGSFFTVVMVLIAQDRQLRLADRRSHLDLQVNLLAEQRTAKLIALMEELRNDLPNVHNRPDIEAEAMQRVADPLQVLEVVERALDEGATDAAKGEADR